MKLYLFSFVMFELYIVIILICNLNFLIRSGNSSDNIDISLDKDLTKMVDEYNPL